MDVERGWEQRESLAGETNEFSASEGEEEEAEGRQRLRQASAQRRSTPDGGVTSAAVPSGTDAIGILIDALPLSHTAAGGSNAEGDLPPSRDPEGAIGALHASALTVPSEGGLRAAVLEDEDKSAAEARVACALWTAAMDASSPNRSSE